MELKLERLKLKIYFVFLFLPISLSAQNQKPNIIFFLVDDMGWQDTSEPFWINITSQNRKFRTPNMERLAKISMKFTNAYATPVCTPSRVSLITGMNVATHKVSNWTNFKNNHTDHADSILKSPNWNINGLQPNEELNQSYCATTLPQVLKSNGYFTIQCGKAHFGAQGTVGANPLNLGFMKNIGGSAAGNPASFLGEKSFGYNSKKFILQADLPNLEQYRGKPIFLTEALTLEAKKALDTAQMKKMPFFLYMAHYAVHLPFDADNRFVQYYLDKGLTSQEAAYAALVEGMDKSLGDLIDYLEQNKLLENTIIMFMSDNGGYSHAPRMGADNSQNAPLRGGKGSVYEGGIREPMMVYWPNVTQKASVNNNYVIIEDFFPTILEMAQINTKTLQKLDGISMVPYLKDINTPQIKRNLLWHYPNSWAGNIWGNDNLFVSAFRSGDWKMVYRQKEGKLELYNLKSDISEQHDLFKEMPDKAKKMAKSMSKLMKKRGAQMPIFVHNGKRAPYPIELF